jgi:hypothetical protein
MATGSKAFDMSKMAIGGIGQVLDSVEFVKRAWSSLNIPSQLVPTMDVEELDKRIADLKAVEQWLNVNLSMLHGTIQGLEIQRGTIAAVKAFGATIGNFATPPADAATPVRSRQVAPEPPPPPVFTPPPAAFTPPPPSFAAAAAAAAQSRSEPAAGKADTSDDTPASKAALPPAMLPGINPTAWWNLLQQNFNQVAQAALSGTSLPAAAAGAAMAAAKGASDGAKVAASRAKASAKPPATPGAPAKAPAKRKRAAAAKARPPRSPA